MARKKARVYGDFETHLAHQLRDPRFRREWERTNREMALATELIRLRIERGLTQAQVAELAHTTQSALSRLETHPPRKITPLLRRVAQLYGLEPQVEVKLVPSDGETE